MHEIISLAEWCERHPIVKKTIEQVQTGYFTVPAFNLWPDPATIDGIDDHQREHLARATVNRIGILGGSPGTGKTFTVSRLIRALIDSGLVGAHEIAVAAPTGKAAVRLNELFSHPDVALPVRAKTIHSLLGVGEHSETGTWGFVHGEGNPLPHKILIVDETSMVDLSLMKSLLSARQAGCHVLLVGDVNQLPPVGVGAPLRDLIAAGLPYGELTEIKRNSGGIVEACAAIRDCQGWLHFARGGNLRLEESRSVDAKIERLSQIAADIAGRPSVSIYDLQILVALNDRSELSRKKLNSHLQDLLNPNQKQPGTIFRVNDKVVCLKNGYYDTCTSLNSDEDIRTNEQGQVYVANGDLGQVVGIEDKRMRVEVTSPTRHVYVPLGKPKEQESDDETKGDDDSKGSGCNWDLGYALSVHKAQGSEARYVVIVLDDFPGARMVCDRAWTYTAISRAKQVCYLIGEPELAERFCRVQKIGLRKTFLRERVLKLLGEREVEGL